MSVLHLDSFKRNEYHFPDINECADPSVSMCGSNSVCVNANGSFACECLLGFEGDTCSGKESTGVNFILFNVLFVADIDECARGTHECDVNANCTNMDGTFMCICDTGFTGSGFQCCKRMY